MEQQDKQVQDEYKSLFEYLGLPAGKLGKEVFDAAKRLGVNYRTREVATKNYNGKVMTYPNSFLTLYFTIKPIK